LQETNKEPHLYWNEVKVSALVAWHYWLHSLDIRCSEGV
jgi:hypothetical protein